VKHFNSNHRQKPAFHKILVITVAFLLLAVPAHASNEVGPYFTFTGSMDMFEDMTLVNKDSSTVPSAGDSLETETELGFTHSIGYQFGNSFSTELEFSYRGGDFGPGVHGDITSKSFLVNGIYSFNIREFYTPYIGYGMGIAFHEASINHSGDRADTTLAYQLKMGVDMELSRKLSLLLGYRYFTTNDPSFDGYFTGETTSHGIEAGVKFYF
jgi:opacity protein-like surface antigen